MNSATKAAQVRLNRVTPSYCRVVPDSPPLNLMGPEFVWQIREVVTELENDDEVKAVVFESAFLTREVSTVRPVQVEALYNEFHAGGASEHKVNRVHRLIAYGFRSTDNLIALCLLDGGAHCPPLPGRT